VYLDHYCPANIIFTLTFAYVVDNVDCCMQQENCTLKESVAVLQDRLLSAQSGDSRRMELERCVASLQAQVIAKDRTLRSEYQGMLLLCPYVRG